ncbi:hypothetical protein FIV34_06760 [Luteibacter pinisoli]|uniref:Uncharacterized protein n=1 Tax=Luteibacter pinisoli TaxID=2589080 RepID=A0A4Y5Z0W8_9GAMM|nr:hypothetical protein [Luteibacter pinisoli]QDE38922.1 hypothetical protein FIV34_06760 [Luteibacter pinisoli]
MALLSVLGSIVLELPVMIAEATWGARVVNEILHIGMGSVSSLAMHRSGMGSLLTTLIVSVPAMVVMFSQGTLGSFLTYSAFSGAGGEFGTNGQPAGTWSSHSLNHKNDSDYDSGARNGGNPGALGYHAMGPTTVGAQPDQVKRPGLS